MYRPNKLKEKLQAGEKVAACWLFSNSSDMAEIVAGAGVGQPSNSDRSVSCRPLGQ